jgi:hypothetical protein
MLEKIHRSPLVGRRVVPGGIWLPPLLLAAALSGCGQDDLSFYIVQMLKPGTGCKVASSGIGEYLPNGRLDVSMKQGYLMFPLLQNSLSSSAQSGGGAGPERNNLHLSEFRVSIDLGEIPGNFPEGLLDFSVLTSGIIPPAGTQASVLKVIPDALAGYLAPVIQTQQPTIIAKIRAVASRSGSDMETADFEFPIILCNGCLVDFRESCPDTETDKTSTYSTNICGLPQDDPVTCCNLESAKKKILKCLDESFK